MEITIKGTTRQQAKLLAGLGAEIFYKTFAAQNNPADMQQYIDETFTEAKLVSEFGEPGALFYIAYTGDDAVGYAKLGNRRTPDALAGTKTMELERLYVHPDYQNQKIGHRLMQHCIDTARANACNMLWLGVWEHHPKAIRFYQRFGFTRFGEHIFQLGSDSQTDWLMKLEL